MTKEKTAAIVLAAGLGTRMESRLPKVLHPLAGRPMIGHLMETLAGVDLERIVVVVGDDMEAVAEAVAPHPTVVQKERLGTGHAVRTACEAVDGFDGTVLVLYADAPLISVETLTRMIEARRRAPRPAVVVLGFRPSDPGPYGRLIVGADGTLQAIVEAGDATPGQGAIALCNSGVMAIDAGALPGLLERIGRDNAKGEYYLTDIVAMARGDGLTCAVVEGDEAELIGVNSRADLARAEAVVQQRLRAAAMAGGATLADPETVYFSHDTRLGRDVTVGPHVVFGPGVAVGDDVEIRAFCHIEGARIATGARIGPFARLRPGADIAAEAHIGNFVEIKNATVETGAKINHLAYVGDSRVGAKANVGAGTITCNYDGFAKHHTDIGAGAFIGSNTALVAPVTVGDGAIIGAGSVITGDVAADALALTRADQEELKGWAKRFRGRRSGRKAAPAKGGG
ncbi:MAG: bifunctional UDP-N-acetylglucosamine diphosphorylase/glucosamine-1-phosphate N-acetyltransferase GlmU [Proteobacteria bacterium]|nr:bifunctional UDP-N-acetylglucosamine diphosphorylase/glucosamine-1-phosphate N-acetyltransferase GlmU [Pseudomonadota bacterium]